MDPEVAMYFACTKYDEDGNLKDMECSKGVVFQETFHISDERNGFSVIPVQLPYRPLEQQGFVRDMSFSPYIVGKKYTFKHDPDFSREISDKMGGREFMFKGFDGTLVEIANVIKQQNVFGTDTLTEAQSMCKTPDSIMKSAELSFIKDTPEWMNQCESTLSSRLPDEWELIDQYSIAESLCNPDSFKPLDYYKYLSLVQTNDINVAIQHDIQKEAIRDIFNNNSVL